MAAEGTLSKAQSRLEDLTERITSSDFWPILRKTDDTRYETLHADVKSLVSALSARSANIETALKDLVAASSSGSSKTKQADNEEKAQMDGAENLTQAGSRKRRRLDLSIEGADLVGPSTSTLGQEPGEVVVDEMALFPELFDRLRKLEDHLSNIDNLVTQQQAHFDELMEERISAFLEELGEMHLSPDHQGDPVRYEAENEARIVLTEMQHQVTKLGEEMEKAGAEYDDLAEKVEKETSASGKRRADIDSVLKQLELFKIQVRTPSPCLYPSSSKQRLLACYSMYSSKKLINSISKKSRLFETNSRRNKKRFRH